MMLYFSLLTIGLALGAIILLPTAYAMSKLLVMAPPVLPFIQQHPYAHAVLDSSISISGSADINLIKQVLYGPMTIVTESMFASAAKVMAVQVLR